MYNCFGVIMRGDLVFEFVVVCFDKWWLQSVFFFFFDGQWQYLRAEIKCIFIVYIY